jgi:dihydrofolate reductase
MRKIIVSVNITLDGFIAGPNCELDWHFKYWSSEMGEALQEQLATADTILLGRITYCAMAKYWPVKLEDAYFSRDDIAFATMMNDYKKIVFSNTLQYATWSNTIVVKGNLQQKIIALKKSKGKNLIVYGSASIIAALDKLNLVDEYILWVHPVIIGKGKKLFTANYHQITMQLLQAKVFGCGVVTLTYGKIPAT